MNDHASRAASNASLKAYAERFHSYPRAVARSLGTQPRRVHMSAEESAKAHRTGRRGWFDDTRWSLRQRRVPEENTKRNGRRRARLQARAWGEA